MAGHPRYFWEGDVPVLGPFAFTPQFTFSNPGDLSVAYTSQQGNYVQIGSVIIGYVNLAFTPTFTTASGFAEVLLPNVPNTADPGAWSPSITRIGPTWPASATMITGIFLNPGGATAFRPIGMGTGGIFVNFGITQFASGIAATLNANFEYVLTNNP